MRSRLQQRVDRLFHPVDAASLGAFRILFGALMLSEVVWALSSGHVRRDLIDARVLFPYEFFQFVQPWPGPAVYIHFVLMALGAAGMMLGLFYRASAAIFLVTYAYAFLLDKGNYNNHYYLIILFGLLFLVVDAQRWASLDQWRRPRPEVIPFWQLALLRAQIVLVFFYGGIAKLNADWLAGEPMRTWLTERARSAKMGPWLGSELAVYFFTYGGLVFDLVIGFLLLSPRTLPVALIGLLAFNLMNHWLFHIGIFPFLMIATAVLFTAPDLPRRVLRLAPAAAPSAAPAPASHRVWVLALLALYLVVQALVPLRHWLYPGDVSWTEEGHRFAWHMKLRSKHGQVIYWVTDPHTGATWRIDPIPDLTLPQRRRFRSSPDMILQYAHHLRDEWRRERGVEDPVIRVDAWLSLNRRPPQALIDGKVDLARTELAWLAPAPWIVPLDPRGRAGSVAIRDFNGYGLQPRRVRVRQDIPERARPAGTDAPSG